MDELKKLCQDYFDAASKDEYISEELKEYVFEAAMEFCLGKEVWQKIKDGRKLAQIEKKKAEIERLLKEI